MSVIKFKKNNFYEKERGLPVLLDFTRLTRVVNFKKYILPKG